jgi:hypothetical protein
MPRIIQTNPDGSPVSNYLTQSARGRPFQTGVIRELPSGFVYGYSGEINYDISASASYTMLDFQLTRDTLFKMAFRADLNVLGSGSASIGYQVSIDGIAVMNMTWDTNPAGDGVMNGNWEGSLFVPANKPCSILLLNPDSQTSLVKATMTLTGNYI